MKSVFRAIFLFAVVCLLTASAGLGQGVGTSGQIQGTVTDPTGGVVGSVSITATDMLKGFNTRPRRTRLDNFRSPDCLLRPITSPRRRTAFRRRRRPGWVDGRAAGGDRFQAGGGNVGAAGGSEAEPPVVETERGSQSDTVTQRYIEDLPISRRDYLTFTLLMPGVSNSNVIASNADFRVQQTPQSGLSFYGSNGRGNNVTVDGGEANDDAGGVRLTLSQDAVQEFQVNRSNYNADLGSASGATINIVSKSGTNEVHGGLFGFFRNDGLDARDPFSFLPALTPGGPFSLDAQGEPVKDSLNRQQFGGTLGFPIRKDKTFMFIGFEGLRSDATDSVPLLDEL